MDDKFNKETGKINPYYPGDGGIMEYKSILNPINEHDVRMIINYANNALNSISPTEGAKVKIIQEIGKDKGNSPIKIKDKNED